MPYWSNCDPRDRLIVPWSLPPTMRSGYWLIAATVGWALATDGTSSRAPARAVAAGRSGSISPLDIAARVPRASRRIARQSGHLRANVAPRARRARPRVTGWHRAARPRHVARALARLRWIHGDPFDFVSRRRAGPRLRRA